MLRLLVKLNIRLRSVKPLEAEVSRMTVAGKSLPDNLIVNDASSKLHQIGLSLFVIDSSRRKRFHNPYFFFVFAWIHTIRCFTAIVLPPQEDRIFFLIGDYPHYMNIGFHYNICYTFCGLIIIALQSIHFIYYWRDIKPSYLRPFELISGSITPEEVGLLSVKDIVKFAKYSKRSLKLTEPYIEFFTVAAGSISVILLLVAETTSDRLLVAIPWIIFHTIAAYIFCVLLSYQLLYFHLICYYLRLKLRQTNSNVMSLGKCQPIDHSIVKSLLQSFESIYSEISEFNGNFWSDFLCVFSGLLIIAQTTSLYSLLFGDLLLFVKLFLGVVNSFFLLILGIVLQDSSSVSFEAFKAYKLLANLFCTNHYQRKVRLADKLKVNPPERDIRLSSNEFTAF